MSYVSEVTRVSSEYFPLVAATAGYVGGSVADAFDIQKKAAAERLALVEQYGEIAELDQTSTFRRIGRALVRPVAAVTLVAAGVNAMAWQPEPATKRIAPQVEVVVDYAGAAAVVDGGQPATVITDFAQEFAESDEAEAQALVARAGVVAVTNPKEVGADSPFGVAPMDEATQTALDNAQLAKSRAYEAAQQKSAGIAVLTFSDQIGEPTNVVARAQAQNTPIFVVNVQGETPNQQLNDELRGVAEASGGQYWSADETEPKAVVEAVTKDLQALSGEDRQSGGESRWPLRALGAASALALLGVYRSRRNAPLTLRGSRLFKG